MRNGFLGSVGALLASAGLVFAQAPYYGQPYGYQPVMQPYYAPAPVNYNYGYGYAPAYAPGYAWPRVNAQPPAPVSPKPAPAASSRVVQAQNSEPIPTLPSEPPLAVPGKPPVISGPPSPTPALPSPGPAVQPGKPTPDPVHEDHPYGETVHGPSCSGGSCGVDGCVSGNCGEACAGLKVWGTAEFLLWRIKDPPVSAPLLTTGALDQAMVAGVPAGALGTPGASVITPSSFHLGEIPGVRINLGGWLTDTHRLGLEVTGFVLPQEKKTFTAASGGDPNMILAVPAFIVPANTEGLLETSVPGVNNLTASLQSRSQLYGGEANVLFHIYNNDWFSIGGLAGGRYLDLTEDLQFNTTLTGDPVNGVPPAPLMAALPNFTIAANDRWATRNEFIGGQIGAKAEARYWFFFANVLAKVAAGEIHQSVNLTGATTFTNIVGGNIETGGHFNLVTNINRQTKDQFGVVPEVQAQVGVEIKRNIRVFAGYDFLYVNTVARPGDQIDRTVNPAALPPILLGTAIAPNSPNRVFNTTNFWAEGLNVGVELRY
jgi:Putative beta barrel porin-7 (BBP7)